MLATDIEHIMNESEYQTTLHDENVMIVCGRNGPMCLPVYDVMESIRGDYGHVTFRVMPFDHPVSQTIRSLPEVRGFMGLPFTVYYKNGKVVKATSSIQDKAQITTILDENFVA